MLQSILKLFCRFGALVVRLFAAEYKYLKLDETFRNFQRLFKKVELGLSESYVEFDEL